MYISPKLKIIHSDLKELINALESPSLKKDEITAKVQAILAKSPVISEDPATMALFRELDFSLNHHGLKDISQKVHQLIVTRKESEQTIIHFHKALKDFQETPERDKGAAAHKILDALKKLSGWENDLETRCALFELKHLLEAREKRSLLSKTWGFCILGRYYAAEPAILQLLQKSPERFALKEEQIQKTVQMSLNADLEGIRFLVLNQEKLATSGISQSFLQSETVQSIKAMLEGGPEVLDVLINCPNEVKFHRHIRIKDIKPLSTAEIDRFYPILSLYEIPYIEHHSRELGLTEEEKEWILSHVTIEGLPTDISFLLAKRFLEKGNDQHNFYSRVIEMASIEISEYSDSKESRNWNELGLTEVFSWSTSRKCIANKNTYRFTLERKREVFNGQQVLELADVAQGTAVLNLYSICKPEQLTQDQLFSFAKLLRTKGTSSCVETHYLWGIEHIKSQERRLELLKMGIAQDPELFVTMDCSVFFKSSQEEALVTEPVLQLFFNVDKELPGNVILQEPMKTMVGKLKEKKELERNLLCKWIGYVLIFLEQHRFLDLGKEGPGLLQKLEGLRPPHLRYVMTKHLWHVLKNPSLKETLESEKAKGMFSQKFTPLFKLVLTPILQEEGLTKIVEILNFDYYNDADRRRIALHAFLVLIENPSFTNAEKASILQAATPMKKKLEIEKEEALLQTAKQTADIQNRRSILRGEKHTCALLLNQNLQIVECFVAMDKVDILRNAKAPEDLSKDLENLFVEVTEAQVENIQEKYLQTFAKNRNPHAIFIYAGKLKELSGSEKDLVFAALKTYVESVLDGTFIQKRYEELPGDHLSKVFAGKRALKELWMEGEKTNYLSLIPESLGDESSSFDVHEFLKRSICLDQHINPEHLAFLNSYLQTKDKNKLPELDLALSLQQDPDQRALLDLEKGLFLLLDESKAREEKAGIFASRIKSLMNLPSLPEQFKADLRDLETVLSTKNETKKHLVSDWAAVDTDNPEDLLLCGTEVLGSCQSTNGFASLNKCLLSYLLDGKNRMIAIKDENGKIMARSIFRLLWDEKEKTPVLFLERTYKAIAAPSNIDKGLQKMALRRSEALGIPLASSEKPYRNPLVSLGSKAPFEYVDAGTGVTNGQYTIR